MSSFSPLIFGLVPHHEQRGQHHLDALCETLARRLDAHVRGHRATTPAALATSFGAGLVHLAWTSPSLYLMSEELREAVPLVSSVREGATCYHAALFTLSDGPLRRTRDLPGARVAWIAPTSASGYIVPRLALASSGLDPRGLFASERFYDSHGRVAQAVAEGEADVGATFACFERGDPSKPLARAGFHEFPTERRFRVLQTAGPIPSDLIVATPRVETRMRARIGATFETLSDHPAARPPLQALFGAERFQAFEPGALDSLRRDVEMGLEMGLITSV